jgi:hypothetical protein
MSRYLNLTVYLSIVNVVADERERTAFSRGPFKAPRVLRIKMRTSFPDIELQMQHARANGRIANAIVIHV